MAARKRLGDLLIESGTIDELQLRSALAHQRQMGGPLGRILVESRFVTEETLVAVLAGQLGLQVVDLDQIAIHPTVLKEVSVDDAESQRVLPVRIQQAEARGAILYLATSDPTNVDVIDTIQFRTGKRVIPLLTTESGLERAIRRHYYADVQQTATVVHADVQFAGEEFELDDGGAGAGGTASSGSPATLELDDGIPVVQGAALLEPSPDAWMLGAGNPLHLTSGDAEVGVLSLAEGQLVTGYDEPPSSVALSSADLASLGLHESTDLLDAREALFDFSNAPSRVVVEERQAPSAFAPPPRAPSPAPPATTPAPTAPEPRAPTVPLASKPPSPTTSDFVSPPTTLLPLEPGTLGADATALPLVVATAEKTPTPPSPLPAPATVRPPVAAQNLSPPEPTHTATVDDGFGPPPPDTGFGVSTSSARFQALLDGLPEGASPRAPGPTTSTPPPQIAAVAPVPSAAPPSTPRPVSRSTPIHLARRERVLDVHELASLESVEPGLVSTLAAAADDVATLSAGASSGRAVAGFAAVRHVLARSVDVDLAPIGALRRAVAGDLLAHDPDAPRTIVPEALHHRLEPATTALDEPTGPSSWLEFAEGQIIANRLSLDDNTDTQSLRLRFMEAKSDEQSAVAPAVTGYVPLPAIPDADGAPPWAPFTTREVSARPKESTTTPSIAVDEPPAEAAAPTAIAALAQDEPAESSLVEPERSAPLPLFVSVSEPAPPRSTTEDLGRTPSAVDVGEEHGAPPSHVQEDVPIALGGGNALGVDDDDIALDERAPVGEVELGAHGGVLDVSSLGLHELSLDEGTGDVPLELDVPSPRAMAPAELDFLDGDGAKHTDDERMPEPAPAPPAWLDAPMATPSSSSSPETQDVAAPAVPSLAEPSLAVPSLDVPPLDVPSLDGPSLDVPSLEGSSLDAPSRDAAVLEASVDDVLSLEPPALDDEATAPIDLASVMGAVPSISSIDSSEAMPPPSAHIPPPRAATPARPAALVLDERTGLAGLVNDAPGLPSGASELPSARIPVAERAALTAEREAEPASSLVKPSVVESVVERPTPTAATAPPKVPAPPRATSTDERLLGLDQLLGGSDDGASEVKPPSPTHEISARDADWRAFLDESPDITSTPLMPEPPSKTADFSPSPDTLLDTNGHSSDESAGSSPPEPAVLVDASSSEGAVPDDGPLGDALEAPTPTMITRLNPDELRALAARLVAKGALTRDDYERAKTKKARDDEDGRS